MGVPFSPSRHSSVDEKGSLGPPHGGIWMGRIILTQGLFYLPGGGGKKRTHVWVIFFLSKSLAGNGDENQGPATDPRKLGLKKYRNKRGGKLRLFWQQWPRCGVNTAI